MPKRSSESAESGKKKSGLQKGAQSHPQGGHGDRTRSKIVEQLHSGGEHASAQSSKAADPPRAGEHKLFEDRQQHDEADKNSEKNRLRKELKRDGGS